MKQKLISGFVCVTLLVALFFVGGCGPKKVVQEVAKLQAECLTRSNGLPDNNITDLAVFMDQVWVGTKNGIARWDGVNWKLHLRKNTNVLGSNVIEQLVVSEGAMWIATDNGVCKFDGNNWSTVMTGARARSVAVKGKEVAVATAHGIEFSTGTPSATGKMFDAFGKQNAGLVYDEVNAVAYDGSGRLWVGTRAGMALFSGRMFQNYTGPAKTVMGTSLIDVPPSPANCRLIGNNVNKIIAFQGKMAIATTSGLSITDMAGQWTNYTAPHKEWVQQSGKIVEEMKSGNSPMPGNNVKALAVDPKSGVLFLGTDKGLAILKENSWVDPKGSWNGPKPLNVTALAVLKDTLWAGTAQGLFKVEGLQSLLPTAEAN